MGLEKDRETIKELENAIKELQGLVLVLANGLAAFKDEIKELKEDHISLRRQFCFSTATGIPSSE